MTYFTIKYNGEYIKDIDFESGKHDTTKEVINARLFPEMERHSCEIWAKVIGGQMKRVVILVNDLEE